MDHGVNGRRDNPFAAKTDRLTNIAIWLLFPNSDRNMSEELFCELWIA